jgi:hypothetical protein
MIAAITIKHIRTRFIVHFFSMLSEYNALGSGRAYATSRERKGRRVRLQTLAEKLRSSLPVRNKEIVARVLCLILY